MNGLTRLSIALMTLTLASSWAPARATSSENDTETIGGLLRGRDGSAIQGSVQYRSFADLSQSGAAPTGTDGTFVIKGLEVGHYELTARADGIDWGVVTTVAQAGAKEVTLELAPGLSFSGKVRTSRARRALGAEPSVRVIGQPLREEAYATSAATAADGTFTLERLVRTVSVVYATTDDGWISRPFALDDDEAFDKSPTLTLREGGQFKVAGLADALWTHYEFSGNRDWVTRFHLGPGEERVVTVPAGEVEVFAMACQGDPKAEPGVHLIGGNFLDVAGGETVDLSGPDALHWEEPERVSMMAIVLLEGEGSLDQGKTSAAMAKTFPAASAGAVAEGPEEAMTIVAMELESGYVLGLGHMLAKVPGNEAADGAKASTFWPSGEIEAAAHTSHVVVGCNGVTLDPVELALELTLAVRSVLDVAGDRALGVLWGTSPAATRADIFQDLTKDASFEAMPLDAWVRFQMVMVEDSDNRGLYTAGLDAFGLMEVEVQPCTTPYKEVFDIVHGIAHYLVSEGPVIEDGDTIGGTEEERIKVIYAPSMVDEDFDVYQIDLK